MSDTKPVAWQWLDTGHFRKKIPRNANPAHWNPLYTADRIEADREAMQMALEALEAERHTREIGQQPYTHWESLRDIRRQTIASTDAAIAALRERLK